MKAPSQEAPAADWDPLSPEALADPLAAHAELRARCPAAYSDRWDGFWTLTRYDDICATARDTETFSNDTRSIPPMDFGQDGPLGIPIELDPPETKKYRQLLGPYFAPKHIARMEVTARELVIDFLDPVLARGRGELVAELAYPLTGMVLCESVLGAPRTDWPRVKAFQDEVIRTAVAGDKDGTLAAGEAINAYLAELLRARRAAPLDPAQDMISGLLQATVDGEPLSEGTLMAIVRLVLPAGHETTSHGIASAIWHLARHPQDQQRLREDPSLIPVAVEELLRCYAPIQQLARRATRDVELHGRTIDAGDVVGLMWLSGNHDGGAFQDAGRCILDRTPNRHLAFGYGVHHCLGAPLARSEMRVTLEELLSRTTHFELDGEVADWAVLPLYGPKSLPMRVVR